jgi:hypothetical protein
VLTWKGKAPTGDSYRARMWISVLKDAAIGLAAICPESSFEARRPMIEAIFSTFHFEEPARDPSVAGTWRHESTYMSGEFSSVTVRYMGLSPDGRATWGSKLHAGMSHTDSGGNFTGVDVRRIERRRGDRTLDGREQEALHRLGQRAGGGVRLLCRGLLDDAHAGRRRKAEGLGAGALSRRGS